ncbi:MBL fold metallo-hydrolase [Prodigiosinella confusarubida]|uniref:MBL fold metallo-hydrolase n=2 Tax=Serratia sp. (strain ATCC 39006) TaxID=104623 RepID=A0A2I5TBH2_SERS3|nr:MBL fold metallo-hydrolase [Serratia sp. ATCC 39006]AUH06243.1 MBL fold metallo-hydrolase [Serratia sp. ATCC 39006]
MLIGLVAFVLPLVLSVGVYLQLPKFGAYPEGNRLERVQHSPHYANGEFHNLVATPILAEGNSSFSILANSLFSPVDNLIPSLPIPAIKTNLKTLDASRDTVVWLGHSSYFVLFAGKRILIDPVFSSYAAPVSFSTKAFDGTNLYTADDIPEIDVLLITHDHWDHLDYATVTALKGKVRHMIVPLGVGAHLERWGYAREKFSEADWYDKLDFGANLAIYLVPARHYSGRWMTRNKTLWTGFVLESATRRILFSGDTGYGPHFKALAQRFGSFDLVALDMGQYDARWPYIHMTPEEAAQAAEDLQTKALLPAHVGRFNIAQHAWYEPFDRISVASKDKPYRLVTPIIGEPLRLDEDKQRFSQWWDGSRPTHPR